MRAAPGAVVPQAVQLLGRTLRDVVTLGDPARDDAAVKAAARLSGADAFVRSLPAGWDTELGGSGRSAGVQPSAGQQQLLALTRALLPGAPVLLLDEATAAVEAAGWNWRSGG